MVRFNNPHKYEALPTALIFVLALILPSSVMANESFRAGIQQFKNAQYQQAISSFNLAQQQGLQSPTIIYNLGVSHYKLKQYSQAKHYFQQLINLKSLTPIAHYNLGLIAHKQGNASQAITQFNKAKKQNSHPKIRQLAQRQLSKLGQSNTLDSFSGFAALTFAGEDNVTLINEDISPQLSQSDQRWDLYSSVSYQINGTKRAGSHIRVAAGSVRYNQYKDYNQDFINAGAYHGFKLKGLQSQLGLHYYHTSIQQQSSQQRINLQARTTLRLAPKNRIHLRYNFSWIDDIDPSVSYLTGWRQKLRIEHIQVRKSLRIKLRYTFELNNREDHKTATSFISYSPTRHSIRLSGKQSINHQWQQKLYFEYRLSQYIREINAGLSLPSKKDQRSRLRYTLIYGIKHNTDLEVDIQRTHHRSTVRTDSYTQNELRLSINYYF